MAQNATIYKVELSVSDMDRHYYETHKLTLAKHPSETNERLMVRILAFALNAHEYLEMTKGRARSLIRARGTATTRSCTSGFRAGI